MMQTIKFQQSLPLNILILSLIPACNSNCYSTNIVLLFQDSDLAHDIATCHNIIVRTSLNSAERTKISVATNLTIPYV